MHDAETSAHGAATSAIARSYRQYRRGVSGDIGDCGVGTPQMCNRVTNHGDMSTFSKPEVLPEIDNLRWTLFLRWLGSGLEAAAESYQRAAEQLRRLVGRREELFRVVSGATESLLSYREAGVVQCP